MSSTVAFRYGGRTVWARSRETAIVAAWLVRVAVDEGLEDDPRWARSTTGG